MRYKAFLMLGVACVLGGTSVFLARGWLERQNQPTVVVQEGPKQEMTTVVVARLPLGFGAELTRENLREVPWPVNAVPDGSFKSVAELLGDERRVALRDIQPNEVMLRNRISGYGGRATLSAVIGGDMRAVTIRVNDVLGVAGFVLPGDRVDVVFTRPQNPHERQSPIRVTDILLQNVKVLAVDQIADDNKVQPTVAKAATLEVSPADAQKLALAAEFGNLSLSLRKTGNVEVAAAETVTFGDLTEPAVPVAFTAGIAPPAPARGLSHTVRIVRGTDETEHEVVPEMRPATPVPAGAAPRVAAVPPRVPEPAGRP